MNSEYFIESNSFYLADRMCENFHESGTQSLTLSLLPVAFKFLLWINKEITVPVWNTNETIDITTNHTRSGASKTADFRKFSMMPMKFYH